MGIYKASSMFTYVASKFWQKVSV